MLRSSPHAPRRQVAVLPRKFAEIFWSNRGLIHPCQDRITGVRAWDARTGVAWPCREPCARVAGVDIAAMSVIRRT